MSAELMVWGLCPSSVSQLSQNILSRFLSHFHCGFPWAIRPDVFWIFEKKKNFQNFQNFFFVYLNMGPYLSHNFKTLLLTQITFESFQTSSEFSCEWSSWKVCFEFEFLIFKEVLALLDYISRAHEIEIRPSSVCCIDYLWSYCMFCFQISVVASPGPYAQTFFFSQKYCFGFMKF